MHNKKCDWEIQKLKLEVKMRLSSDMADQGREMKMLGPTHARQDPQGQVTV